MSDSAPDRIRNLRQELAQLQSARSPGEEISEEILELQEELAETIRQFQSLTCEGMLLATASCQPVEQAADSGLRFDWGPPDRPRVVMVEEEIDKQGKTAKMRYEVWLQPIDDDALHRAEIRGLQFLQVEGRDATTAEMRQRLATATVLAQSIPHIQVDGHGRFVGITGFERLVSQLSGMGHAVGTTQIRSMSSSAAKFWYAWVGSWVGLPIQATNTDGTAAMQHVLPDGLAIQTKANWSCRDVPDHPDLWSLKLESHIAGAAARPLIGEALAFFFRSEDALDELLENGYGTKLRLQALVEPKTLRPHHVVREIEATVQSPGGEPMVRTERQSFTFRW